MSGLSALLLQRCPKCREGKIFRTGVTTFEYCRVCLLRFEREEGYFLGAMYFSYFLSIPVVTAFFIILRHVAHMSPGWAILGAMIVYCPLIPITVRYSRVLWIWWDRTIDP